MKLAVLAVLVLSGCSAEHRAAIEYMGEQARTVNDTEARVLLQTPCAMSVGAYWRALNELERDAVARLCGR